MNFLTLRQSIGQRIPLYYKLGMHFYPLFLQHKLLHYGLALVTLLFLRDCESALQAQAGRGEEAVRFAYQHYNGQQYHITAQVDEKVFRKRNLIYSTQILNRIAIKVAGMTGKNALLDVNYQVSEQAENGQYFSWATESDAQFAISPLGLYSSIPRGATNPSLRNVPSFPDRDLMPGAGWTAPASEVQDLSDVFGVPMQLNFNFTVSYMYRGEKVFEGRKLKHITLFYHINEDISKQLPASLQSTSYSYSARHREDNATQKQDLPRAIRAQHNIELYWDSERGLPAFQREDFEISYLLESGDEVKFQGRSRGNIIESEPMAHKNLKSEVEQDLQNAGIAADVQQNDKGISISIDSINFYPNSERMLLGEERKLEQISSILQKYPNRDILITGHTADLGKPQAQLQLSEKRAASVGQYFIQKGIRSQEQLVIRGMGGSQAIASNNTDAGRKKNRRVEITLLEN